MSTPAYAEKFKQRIAEARERRAADAKARVKAARGTKHPRGATKATPTPAQRAARRRQAARSRRKNR